VPSGADHCHLVLLLLHGSARSHEHPVKEPIHDSLQATQQHVELGAELCWTADEAAVLAERLVALTAPTGPPSVPFSAPCKVCTQRMQQRTDRSTHSHLRACACVCLLCVCQAQPPTLTLCHLVSRQQVRLQREASLRRRMLTLLRLPSACVRVRRLTSLALPYPPVFCQYVCSRGSPTKTGWPFTPPHSNLLLLRALHTHPP
jgi:hypothetical protein